MTNRCMESMSIAETIMKVIMGRMIREEEGIVELTLARGSESFWACCSMVLCELCAAAASGQCVELSRFKRPTITHAIALGI